MPRVPIDFAPSVSSEPTRTPPLGAPMTAPMENGAPQQIEQLGATVAQAGASLKEAGQTIGDRIQETMDDAQTKNAETQFIQNASQVVTGYTHKLGQDAVDGFGDAQQAVVKAKSDAEATLTNDLQRRMFNYVASQHLTTLGKTLSDHQFQQGVKFGADAANDRSDSMIQQAANSYGDWQRPDGQFAAFKGQAVQEALHGARLLGLPPDSPQAKDLVREKTSELASGVITRMADSEQYDEAQNYYQTALAAGEMDERTAQRLGNMVMEGHNSQKGKNLAAEAKQDALGAPAAAAQQRVTPIPGASITTLPVTDTMGSPRPGGRVHDGIDIAVPVGTNVQAPADGTVSKVWNDDKFGGGLSMEVSYPDGSVEGFAHLSAANYQPGQKVTQGAILAQTGKTGNATGPVLHWSMKNADGQWVDPRGQSPAAKPDTNFTDPGSLQKGIDYINGSEVTDRVKDIAINQLKSDYTTAREIQNQGKQQTFQSAKDAFYQSAQQSGRITGSTWQAIPPSVFSQLTPEQQYDFQTAGREKDETSPENFSARYWFATHPYFTQQDVMAQAKNLTPTQVLDYAGQASKRENSADDKNASIDKMQLENSMQAAGLGNLVHMDGQTASTKAANQQRYVEIYNDVQDIFNAAQQSTKRPLTPDERKSLIDGYLTDNQVYVHKNGFFGSSDSTQQYAGLTDAQIPNAWVDVGGEHVNLSSIPPAKVQAIRRFLIGRGVAPTWQQIAWWWKQNGK